MLKLIRKPGQVYLGAASINVAWSDAEGLVVTHGSDGTVLAKVEPENLEREDWDRIWDAIDGIVKDRGGFRQK